MRNRFGSGDLMACRDACWRASRKEFANELRQEKIPMRGECRLMDQVYRRFSRTQFDGFRPTPRADFS